MSDDIIRRALGMGEGEQAPEDSRALVPYNPNLPVEEQDISEEINKDIAFARDNHIGLIAQSQEAIDELMMIAKQSQHPRAFEVIANLIKTSADLNDGLVNLHKKKQDLKPKQNVSVSPTGAKTVNNNLFVGSTFELQKMLDEMKNKSNDQ